MASLNGSNGSGETGNTKVSPTTTKRDSAAKMWCFTLNNYTNDELNCIVTMFKNGSNGSNKFIIGHEIGESGTPHLQGYVNFNEKQRFSAITKINPRISWHKCKGTEQENITYCSKDKKYTIYRLTAPRDLVVLTYEKLYQWQKDIVDIINKNPDNRTIYWYWDEIGNVGKSALAKHLCFYNDAFVIDGKKADILYAATTTNTDCFVLDFSREVENRVPYESIEKLKNGLFFSGKYESKMVLRNPPHIICFANFYPDITKLSNDRWVITELKNQN